MIEINTKRPIILIIDDDEVNRKVLEMLLKQEQIDFMLAETGEQGLKFANDHLPDLILLDLLMPNEDGLSILQQFRSNPLFKSVPIIVFTIIENDAIRLKAFELGATDYLTKPFDMTEIIKEIKRRLNFISEKNSSVNLSNP